MSLLSSLFNLLIVSSSIAYLGPVPLSFFCLSLLTIWLNIWPRNSVLKTLTFLIIAGIPATDLPIKFATSSMLFKLLNDFPA